MAYITPFLGRATRSNMTIGRLRSPRWRKCLRIVWWMNLGLLLTPMTTEGIRILSTSSQKCDLIERKKAYRKTVRFCFSIKILRPSREHRKENNRFCLKNQHCLSKIQKCLYTFEFCEFAGFLT